MNESSTILILGHNLPKLLSHKLLLLLLSEWDRGSYRQTLKKGNGLWSLSE